MNTPIRVWLTTARILRLVIVVVLVVVPGRKFNASAQTVTILHSFPSSLTDGQYPKAGLAQGTDGNFYGTTELGGSGPYNGNGGTLFRITPSGSYTSLYSFGSQPNDGIYPVAGLVQGSDSNFYGTTSDGGTNGNGTIFRISPSGSYTNLHLFVGRPTDGSVLEAPLIQGSDGNFYGTTINGGSNGPGTVFQISSAGSVTLLHSFNSDANGSGPIAGLVRGSDGNFYGMTVGPGYPEGQTFSPPTVFVITATGTLTTLHSFTEGAGGSLANPVASLIQGRDGYFYGTTPNGGTNAAGSVFKISSTGSFTNLYTFSEYGDGPDGGSPEAALVQGSDGNFYGTTYGGGASNWGTVFRISPSGSLTTLYSFTSSPNDGANPYGVLVQGSDGNFYGTTYKGGTNNLGTVFKLTIPLNPPPNQITGAEPSGSDIIFNIPSVAGETYQLQFSGSMNPTNWVDEGGPITSIGAMLTLTNFGGAVGSQGFYRFAITP